jgi:hypothetical protein
LSSPAVPFVTAGLRPEFFGARARAIPRPILALALSLLVISGFAFRVRDLAGEGLSEDELNKLTAVNDYRSHGLTSSNGEHPFLMKAALTASVVAAERWNATSYVSAHPDFTVPVETALRLPNVIIGALTAILIFLLAKELFGLEVGLLAAALWSLDPMSIGFNRIAKEDTFLTFFFLLANIFWLRAQRVAESQPHRRPDRFYWATAVAFAAMLASKYLPQLLTVMVAYYWIFQRMEVTRWRLGKKKFLQFFAVTAIAFLIFNPTIVLPSTWKAMASFSSYKQMGHDSYEFMGRLYTHRMSDWLRGEPWYFYGVLVIAKLPLATLGAFAAGFILLWRRATGDGRYLMLFWLFVWGMTFTFTGGKFTRYITSALPVVMITAALGVQFLGRHFASWCARALQRDTIKVYVRAALTSLVILVTFWSATRATPHYRLYMNSLAGGVANAGAYFPQDEFYDAYMRDAVREIAKHAPANAIVVSEIETVSGYYAQREARGDLISLDLSNPGTVDRLRPGDFLIDARGRTYLSNQAMLTRLRSAGKPAFTVNVGRTPAADVYVLDQKALAALLGK